MDRQKTESRLKKFLALTKASRKNIEEKCEIPPTTLHQWERGLRQIHEKHLPKIDAFLKDVRDALK